VLSQAAVPYCGLPVDPQVLLRHWNLDPALLACLALLLVAYCVKVERATRARSFFIAGWACGALALISPLCAASVSLFTARIAQHLILATVAAPLIAFGLPKMKGALARPVTAAAAFTFAMWLWEAPGPYAATFSSSIVYWLMHISVAATAVWLWCALIAGTTAASLAASFASMMQMSLLGALLTFAPRALYAWHFATTAPYGFSPLEDQQLGGILMWVPGSAPFIAVALYLAAKALTPAPRPVCWE
jgi:putative membrane protein